MHRLNKLPITGLPAWMGLSVMTALGLSLGLQRSGSSADATATAAPPASGAAKPTLFLIGDSTVNNGTRGQQGWGTSLPVFFDGGKINVVNRARGGRSSRTFFTEGLWDKVVADLKPGDFVLMQFGHNDGGSLRTNNRASIKGSGDETREVVDATGKKEVVHTFGWYLRKYIADTKSKGATPIVLSLIPRNDWQDGKVFRASTGYGRWAEEAAKAEGVPFVDLNGIIANRYDQLGQEKVKEFFPVEHTHTNAAGADLNAAAVVEGLKGLPNCPLCPYLSARGEEVRKAPATPAANSISAATTAPSTASPAPAADGGGASVQSKSNTVEARRMEKLGRGVVAVKQGDGKVFVGWRMLGTDPDDIAFNLYRATSGGGAVAKLNQQPITGATSFVDGDAKADQDNAYFVRPVLNGQEQVASASFTLPANAAAKPYLSVPLQTPQGYTPNDASVADLDGDGEYEIVLHQTGRGKDNSQAGETDPPILQAYKLDGTLLWTINLGKNIREGAHYTQFMVYDLDGDGKAEMVCKTADGTTDGAGTVIGDAQANYVNEQGKILAGPEFLTVFDGLTGKALATTNYVPARHPTKLNPTSEEMAAIWGDGTGNRGDRFLACVAYLDGVRPSVVMCRGYYSGRQRGTGRTVLAAWDWRDGKLTQRWVFDTMPNYPEYVGQGNHSLSVGDVDEDGKDEIVYGKIAIDDDGKPLYNTRIGHGDANHLTDIDTERPGLELFSIQEPFGDAGAHLFDARTGEILWKKASVKAGNDGEGPGRGLALDVDPRYPGLESWVAGAGLSGQMWDAKGNKIADKTPSVNMGIWWDGDLLREPLDGTKIDKWDYLNGKADRLLSAHEFGCAANNGSKANPALSADILGDWREEVIYRTTENNELRIFTTTIPTEHRFYTLMHDPIYRLSIAWQNVAYNQPPHTGFYLGPDMKSAPRPNITIAQAKSGN